MADVSCRPANQDGCDAVSTGLTAATKGCDGGMAGKLSAPAAARLRVVENGGGRSGRAGPAGQAA